MGTARDEGTRPLNTHDQVGKGGVYITHVSPEAREPFPRRWQVIRVGYKNDPDAAWYDHGRKTFSHFGGKEAKAEALEEAKQWAGRRYGIKNWKRNRRGDWIDADAGHPSLRKAGG